MLTSPLLWIIVAIVAIAAVVVIFRFRARSEWGFREVVKDPGQWSSEMERASRALERATEEAKQWNESQVSAAVNHFVFDVSSSLEASGDARILKSLGTRIHPTVLQILGDTSRRSKLVKPTGENLLPEAPFNRACNLRGDAPPTNAAALIAPFLDDPADEIRKDAALVLGTIGTQEVLTPLRKAFADPDEYVRSCGLIGLQRAIENHRLDEQCARELYQDIAQLVIAGKNHDQSAALLLSIDPTRATDLFLSDRVFTATAPSLHEALEALADKRIAVPRERLLSLIADLEKSELKYPKTYALGESLRLLGQHKLASDRPFLEARTSSSEPRVAAGAAAGLIASFDLEGFEQRTWDAKSTSGFSTLKPAQKQYLAVLMYDGEVNNGGLSQYFFNSSGDHWRDALAGLAAMGFSERHTVLREAVSKFGKDGPSQDRERRQEELAKLARKNDALFDALDDRYYKSKEVIEVLTQRHVLQNAGAFK